MKTKRFLSMLMSIVMLFTAVNGASIVANSVTLDNTAGVSDYTAQDPVQHNDEVLYPTETADEDYVDYSCPDDDCYSDDPCEVSSDEPDTEEEIGEIEDPEEFVSPYTEHTLTGEFEGRTVAVIGNFPDDLTLSLNKVEHADKLLTKLDKDEPLFACDINLIAPNGDIWISDEKVNISISGFNNIAEDKSLEVVRVPSDIDYVISELTDENADELVTTISDVVMIDDGEFIFSAYGSSTFIAYTVDFNANAGISPLAESTEGTFTNLRSIIKTVTSDTTLNLNHNNTATNGTITISSGKLTVKNNRSTTGNTAIFRQVQDSTATNPKLISNYTKPIFTLSGSGSLELQGKNKNEVLILDGRYREKVAASTTKDTADEYATKAFIKISSGCTGTLTMNNVRIQNARANDEGATKKDENNKTVSTAGSETVGIFANGGNLDIKNTEFINLHLETQINNKDNTVSEDEDEGDGDEDDPTDPSDDDEENPSDNANQNITPNSSIATLSDTNTTPTAKKRYPAGAAIKFGSSFGVPPKDKPNAKVGTANIGAANNGVVFDGCEVWDEQGKGGAIAVYGENSNINLNNCEIKNCKSNNGSAIYYAGSTQMVTASLTNCNIHNNTAYEHNLTYGGGNTSYGTIRTTGGTDVALTVTNCKIHHNHSCAVGGGIYWNASGNNGITKLTVDKNTKIYGNVAVKNGGGIYCAGDAEIKSCEIYGNVVTGYYYKEINKKQADGSTAKVGDTNIGKGGGIAVQPYGGQMETSLEYTNIELSADVSIHDNKAKYGGGISLFATDGGPNSWLMKDNNADNFLFSATIKGAKIYNNEAACNGGGIHYETDTGTAERYIKSIVIESDENNNEAKVYNNKAKGETIDVSNLSVEGEALPKDYYYENDKTFERKLKIEVKPKFSEDTDGAFQSILDKDIGSGGGIYMTGKGAKITMYSGEVKDNTAVEHGGGIYLGGDSSEIHITNKKNGMIISTDGGKIYNNTSKLGGGIYISGTNSLLDINDGKINENIATDGGGGVFLTGTETKIDMDGGEISDNGYETIKNDDGKEEKKPVTNNGGGIYVDGDDSEIQIDGGSKINNNKVKNNGGGIFVTGNKRSLIDMDDGEINSNTANNYGGGIYLTGNDSYIDMSGGQVYDNTATNGGGISITGNYTSVMTIANATINDNKATDNGGGIYLTGANSIIDINSGEIRNNTATNYHGGGIYLNGAKSKITIAGGDIHNNTANGGASDGGYGGGIYVRSGDISVSKGNIFENTAVFGGGVFIEDGKFESTGGNFYCNTGTSGGGAVYVWGNEATGDDSITSKFIMHGGIIGGSETNANNSPQGGGVAVYHGEAEIYGGTISYNSAARVGGGIYVIESTVNISGGAIFHNKTDGDGAGLYVTGSTVNIFNGTATDGTATNGSINNNIAQGWGGGIFAEKDSTVTISGGGKIEENKARNGGGLVAYSGSSVIMKDGGFVRNNEAIDRANNSNDTAYQLHSENNFGGVGGGIFVSGIKGQNPSTFEIVSTTGKAKVGIYGNIADWAADDVFANGLNTQVIVPAVEDMDLEEYNGDVTGWYKDYHENDFRYSKSVYGCTTTENGKSVEQAKDRNNNTRYRAENSYRVETFVDAKDNDGEEAELGKYINDTNAYVCITLGKTPESSLKVVKKVVNRKGEDIGKLDQTDYNFVVYIRTNTGDNFAGGVKFTKKLQDGTIDDEAQTTDDGEFTLKANEVAYFSAINGTSYTIKEIKNNITYIISTRVTNNMGEELLFNDNQTKDADVPVNIQEDQMLTVTFTNMIKSLTFDFKYYDRTVANGQPADISDIKTFSVTYAGKDYNEYVDSNNNVKNRDMMLNAIGKLNTKLDSINNVLDEYYVYATQEEFETGVGEMPNPHDNGEKYGRQIYHTDRYGRPQTSGDKWITYIGVGSSGNSDPVNPNDAVKATIWLFNTPKSYRVIAYTAGSSSAQLTERNGKYVAGGTPYIKENVYYNQRIGNFVGGDADSSTNFLAGYEVSGVIQDCVIKTNDVITKGDTTYYFQYWAFDPEGKQIASTASYYNRRVTNNLTLYAVYGTSPYNSDGVGLTVIKNDPDVYIDLNGVSKTRLNTVMNPYNCVDCDSKIKAAAIIYVIAPDEPGNRITLDNDQLDKLKGEIKSKLQGKTIDSKTNFSEELTVGKANFFVHVVGKEKDEIALTNKNRVQFVTDFKTSSLANKHMFAFSAMNYVDDLSEKNWIVSDNFIDYTFDESGKNV